MRNIAATVAIFLFLGCQWATAQTGVTLYNMANSGLPDNSVWAIAVAPDGTAWIGTDWGLARFDGSTWQVYQTINSGLPNDGIRSLLVDDSSHVWVGTVSGGLARFDGSNWTVYNTGNSGLPSDHVRCLGHDRNGGIYAGTDDGLAKLEGGFWTVWDLPTYGIGSNNVVCLYVEGEDSVWLGTINGGMVHIMDTTIVNFNHSNSGLLDNTQVGIVKDSGDDLWIATPSNGLVYYQNLVFLNYNATNSGNPTMSHSSVILDGNEAKWAGSLDKGVVYYKAPTWRNYDATNSPIPQNYVRCLALDPVTGFIWGGTEQMGAFLMDPNGITASEELVMAEGFRVFPNPATDWVHFQGYLDVVEVMDVNGRRMLREEKVSEGVFVGDLPAGVYVVAVRRGRSEGRTRLVIGR